MNQAQRNFLIQKIEEQFKVKKRVLHDEEPKAPSLSNWIMHSILSGNFELQPTDVIREAIRLKAFNTKEGSDFLGTGRWGQNNGTIELLVSDILVIPEEYKKMAAEYRKQRDDNAADLRNMEIQKDSLITRIQLASSKTLEKMINEVDDMGDVSLIDTKLRLISGGAESKLLGEGGEK